LNDTLSQQKFLDVPWKPRLMSYRKSLEAVLKSFGQFYPVLEPLARRVCSEGRLSTVPPSDVNESTSFVSHMGVPGEAAWVNTNAGSGLTDVFCLANGLMFPPT
jgi:hypothetical protein